MRLFLKQIVIALYLFSVVSHELSAFSFEEKRKAQMIQDLDIIRHQFEVGYAPANWKKEYAGWDLEEAFEQAKHQILTTPTITTKQFQQIVRRFLQTPKDLHVGVLFYSTEEASLPFGVKGIDGRYFIQWIDPLRLSSSHCALRVGDELLEFDGRPITEVMEELKRTQDYFANPYTTQAMADFALTQRLGAKGDTVPKGTIKIKTRSVDSGDLYSFQLIWDYHPEYVRNSLDFLTQSIGIVEYEEEERTPAMMMNPVHELSVQKMMNRYGGWGMGAYKSFLPPLGKLLWDKDAPGALDTLTSENAIKQKKEKKEEGEEGRLNLPKKTNLAWYAYIYEHPKGYPIGYIRIPHYRGLEGNAEEFGQLIQLMQEKTEALVIDQLNNFGGWAPFTYTLASMLTKEPLTTPYHRFKITQKDALIAYATLEKMNSIDFFLKVATDKLNPSLNHQQILFNRAFSELILEEWNAGHTLTRPTPIDGVDMINPHPKFHYTKPILMLINELDMSGGDFMAAILRDNERATLFGSRTAGAGGVVKQFKFSNQHGIALCCYTGSIAERVNLQKIEDLGITPDIEYHLTVHDLQHHYEGYVSAVNQAVETLLEAPPQSEPKSTLDHVLKPIDKGSRTRKHVGGRVRVR